MNSNIHESVHNESRRSRDYSVVESMFDLSTYLRLLSSEAPRNLRDQLFAAHVEGFSADDMNDQLTTVYDLLVPLSTYEFSQVTDRVRDVHDMLTDECLLVKQRPRDYDPIRLVYCNSYMIRNYALFDYFAPITPLSAGLLIFGALQSTPLVRVVVRQFLLWANLTRHGKRDGSAVPRDDLVLEIAHATMSHFVCRDACHALGHMVACYDKALGADEMRGDSDVQALWTHILKYASNRSEPWDQNQIESLVAQLITAK